MAHVSRNIRVQQRDESGLHDVADGTHVYLDFPGGPLQFRHFVVQGNRLRLADQSQHQATFETSYAHWCVWGQEQTSLQLHPNAVPFAPVPDFGYPLPARFTRNRLILPGRQRLNLRIVDAAGHPATSAKIDRQVASATSFYDRLGIDVVEAERHTLVPPDETGLILKLTQRWDRDAFVQRCTQSSEFLQEAGLSAGGNHTQAILNASIRVAQATGVHQLIWNTPNASPVTLATTQEWSRVEQAVRTALPRDLARGRPPANSDQASFQDAPWNPPAAERDTTILVIYVNRFLGMGASAGVAWPYVEAFSGIVEQGQLWDHARCPYVFMAVDVPPAGQNVSNPLPHEIAHCLLNDAGMSHSRLNTFEQDYHSVTGTQDFLGGLGIETRQHPGRVLYARHVEPRGRSMHEEVEGNLMGTAGGSTLMPWQVAVIRASRTIGDGPTTSQARLARQAPALPENP